MEAKLLHGGFFEGMLLLTPLDGIAERVLGPSLLTQQSNGLERGGPVMAYEGLDVGASVAQVLTQTMGSLGQREVKNMTTHTVFSVHWVGLPVLYVC